jgi:hypothetical protein
MRRLVRFVLTALLCMSLVPASFARAGHRMSHHHSKMRAVASVAAPIAIGAAAGPAGSIGYQVVKHRKAIKRGMTGHHKHRHHKPHR